MGCASASSVSVVMTGMPAFRQVAMAGAMATGSVGETISTFEDQNTALAWRDQLRSLGIEANCAADHPLDQFGQGDIYLVVPPEQWSRASEIIDNLD